MINIGNKRTSMHLLLGILIMLWLNAGNAEFIVYQIPSFLKFGFVILWFLGAVYKVNSYLTKFISTAFPMIIFVSLIYLSNYVGNNGYYKLYFQSYLYILILLALFCYYFNYGTPKENKILIAVYLIDVLTVSIRTLFTLFVNPIVARAISTGAESQQLLLKGEVLRGIGGYGLCYALVFLLIVFLWQDGFWKNRNYLKMGICLFVLLLLFKSQITLSLLLSVLVIGLYVITMPVKKPHNMLLKALCVICLIALFLNITEILEYAISVADAELGSRLQEVLSLIQTSGTDIGSDLNARFDLYAQSWYSFLSNPLVGSFGERSFGCHSTLLDMMAAFGILGLLGIWGIARPLIQSKKTLMLTAPEKTKLIVFLMLFFLVFSCINVSHGSEIMVVLILIAPLVFKEYSMKI